MPPELRRAPQVVEQRHLAGGGADGRELRLVAAEHSGPLASQLVGRVGHPVRRLHQVAAAAHELENVRRRQGRRDADVQAIREAVLRHVDPPVARRQQFGRDARRLRAEDERHAVRQRLAQPRRAVGQHGGVLAQVRAPQLAARHGPHRRDHLRVGREVAHGQEARGPPPVNRVFRVERVVRGPGVGRLPPPPVLARARPDGLVVGAPVRVVRGVLPRAFRLRLPAERAPALEARGPRGRRDDPDVLDAQGLAGPEDGAVVVAVHEALEHDDQPARPPRQHRFYPLREPLPVVGALEALRRGLRLPQRCRDARRRREERSSNAGQCCDKTASHRCTGTQNFARELLQARCQRMQVLPRSLA